MATTSRRQLLQLALAQGMGPVFVRHARAADLPRVALGVASGQPQANGLVLWTRLKGEDLPPEVAVDWELAEDEAFQRVAARGSETAVADLKVDFDDPHAPVVASELCGASHSSRGVPQAGLDGLRGHNPHLH